MAQGACEQLMQRLFGEDSPPLLNFKILRGGKSVSKDELCSEILKGMDQVRDGTSESYEDFPEQSRPGQTDLREHP